MTAPRLEDSSRQIIVGRHLLILALIVAAVAAGILTLVVDPIYVAAGVAGLIIFALIVKYEYFGLIVYLLVFIFRPGETYTALNAVRFELILGATLAFLTLLKNKYKYGSFTLQDSRLNQDYLLIIGAMALSLIFSACKDCTVESLQNMVKLGVFYLLIVLIVDSRKRLEIFFWVFLLAIAKSAFDITFGFYHGQAVFNQGLNRATATNSAMDNFNGIAITMNTVIPFVYYLFLHYKEWWKKGAMGLMLVLFVWTLIVTGSRGGLLGFLAILVIIWCQSKNKMAMALLLIIFLAVGWTALGEDSKARYLSIFADNLDASSENRIKAWIDGFMLFISRPLSGVGAGAFANARAEAFGVYLNPHNLYIQIIAELGLIGVVVYFLFMKDLFGINMRTIRWTNEKKTSNRLLEPIARATIVSGASLLVTGIFAHSAYRYTWYLLAALTVVAEHLRKTEDIETAKNRNGDPKAALSNGEDDMGKEAVH
jgi:probable O-glycosylation ligase (exosortase A-associated)